MMPATLVLMAALLPAAVHAHSGASAAGQQGDPAAISRVLAIGMHDSMRFAPGRLTVRRNETVRFDMVNAGQVMHELVLGTPDEIARHREAMRRDPDMAHDGPAMAHVAPGERASMVWQFTQAGVFEYACLLPGHYEAGMRGAVTVNQ